MSTRQPVQRDPQPVDAGLIARLQEAEHLITTLRDRATALHATVLMRDQEIAELRAQLEQATASPAEEKPAKPATKKTASRTRRPARPRSED